MGLARKGSHTIAVADRTFRWVVSADSGFMALVAELARRPGQRLEAQFGYQDERDPESGALRQRCQITPKVVRSVILSALSRGWQPEKRGLPPMRLDGAGVLTERSG